MHSAAQGLAVHPADFTRSLAVFSLAVFALKHQGDREHPPCRPGAASPCRGGRNSLAVKSSRVIPIAAIVASFAPMAVSQSSADSGIPFPESKFRLAGIN